MIYNVTNQLLFGLIAIYYESFPVNVDYPTYWVSILVGRIECVILFLAGPPLRQGGGRGVYSVCAWP